MKNFAFAFCGVSAVIVGSLPQSAEALPFYQNCASMQSYLNSKPWKTPTRLSGMENSQIFDANSIFHSGRPPRWHCQGYITESSPMGTKVCKGDIFYDAGNRQYYWQAESNASCRWR